MTPLESVAQALGRIAAQEGHDQECIRYLAPQNGRRGKSTRTYTSWMLMRRRCLQPGDQAYPDYGGRGITICERWGRFENFLADLGERPKGTTLDRLDPNGNYELGNCRWATPLEQHRTMRTSRLVTYQGRTLTTTEWAREVGLSPHTITYRLGTGWTVAQALETPPISPAQRYRHPYRQYLTWQGERLPLELWAIRQGLDSKTIRNRLTLGWSLDKALTTPPRRYRRTA